MTKNTSIVFLTVALFSFGCSHKHVAKNKSSKAVASQSKAKKAEANDMGDIRSNVETVVDSNNYAATLDALSARNIVTTENDSTTGKPVNIPVNQVKVSCFYRTGFRAPPVSCTDYVLTFRSLKTGLVRTVPLRGDEVTLTGFKPDEEYDFQVNAENAVPQRFYGVRSGQQLMVRLIPATPQVDPATRAAKNEAPSESAAQKTQ